MFQGTGKAIELGNDQDVALAQSSDGCVKLGTVLDRRDLFVEDVVPIAAGPLQQGQLGTKAGVLLDGAGPGIADLHTMRFLYHMSVMIV